MKQGLIAISLVLLAGVAGAGRAQAQDDLSPVMPRVLTERERAAVRDAWLGERFETVLPALMREHGIDMWVMIAREYAEDPVMETMFNATSFRARRRTILVFHDPGEGKPVERLTVSRYGMGDFFEPAWVPEEEPDQWKRLARIITERDPAKIAVNVEGVSAFADGLTASQWFELMDVLPLAFRGRIVSAYPLAIGWLERRTSAEIARYGEIVRIAHAIIGEAFSDKVIEPGKTTAADIQWWMRDRVARLGLEPWFHPSVAINRMGEADDLRGDVVVEPGDLLWTDFGITYLGLNTDTQQMAYVLKPGESDAPAGLKSGLAASNRVQDHLTASFRAGDSGNEILARARKAAIVDGLDPSIYSHPIGYHGHGAGPAIGFWDNQAADPRGADAVRPNTAWSIELKATHAVPEWDGQAVGFKTEEDAWFDGQTVHYLDGRQTRFHLIGGAR